MAIGRYVEVGVVIDDDGFPSISVSKPVGEDDFEELNFTFRQAEVLQILLPEALQEMLALEWDRSNHVL